MTNPKSKQYAEAEIYDVRYTSIGKKDVTERTIIPIEVPAVKHIKALDVTQYTGQEQVHMRQLWEDYAGYRDAFVARMFDFETWLEHTNQTPDVELKYRTFVVENLEPIE